MDIYELLRSAIDVERGTEIGGKDEKRSVERIAAFALASIAESLKTIVERKVEIR